MKRFTPDEDQFLKQHYLELTLSQLSLETGRSIGSIYQRLKRLDLNLPQEIKEARFRATYDNLDEGGKATRFSCGHTPANKGKKMTPGQYEKSKATMFKPGHVPATMRYNGKPYLYYRKRKDGYIEKLWFIQEGKNKRSAYLAYLCRNNGIDLTGKKPILRPGYDYSQPPTIDDIMIISCSENMKRNTIYRYPKDLVKLIRAKGALNRQINKLQKDEK